MPLDHLELERLKLLFDYTQFHIGLYATLITALIAAREAIVPRAPDYLKWTLVCFLIAGAAGGVVASSIPDFSTYSSFVASDIGPFGWKPMMGQRWINLEHFAFWCGITWAGLNAFIGAQARQHRNAGFGATDKRF